MNFSAVRSIFSSKAGSYRKGINEELIDLKEIVLLGKLLHISSHVMLAAAQRAFGFSLPALLSVASRRAPLAAVFILAAALACCRSSRCKTTKALDRCRAVQFLQTRD